MAKIIQSTGSIFNSPAEAIVNPVNCVGVLGAGLAKQFAQLYPVECKVYQDQCKQNKLKIGNVLLVDGGAKRIYHVPTKDHWRNPSLYTTIDLSLEALTKSIIANKISSIAIPRLGCGLGGLDWSKVRPKIVKTFESIDVDVYLY